MTTATVTANLTVLTKSRMPVDFSKAVAMLQRPYFPISEDEYKRLLAILQEYKCDCFQCGDYVVVTIGSADDGYAIMPLAPQYARQFMEKNP